MVRQVTCATKVYFSHKESSFARLMGNVPLDLLEIWVLHPLTVTILPMCGVILCIVVLGSLLRFYFSIERKERNRLLIRQATFPQIGSNVE